MKAMGFSDQEEQILNSSEATETGEPDLVEAPASADSEAGLTDSELESSAEEGVAPEAGESSEEPSAEVELADSDIEISPPEPEEHETEEDSEAAPVEEEPSEMNVESAVEQVDESEAEEPLVEDEEVESESEVEEPLVEDEEVESESEVEEPVVEEEEVESEPELEEPVVEEEEVEPEPEIEEPVVEEEEVESEPEVIPELSAPVPEPVSAASEDDSPEVSLDFLDQDADSIEGEEDGRSWFVVHCYSGYENKVRHNLEQRIETMGMKDKIFDIVVPTEEEIEVREGKRRTVERRVFPGYILVNMVMTEESWYVVRNTPGVTGFVGMGNTPTPLRPEEVSQIIKRMEAEAPRIKVTFKAGERVRIVDGPFNDFRGTVAEIDMERAKVRVMVNFFGRETPVELDFLQVEKT
jgi:transcriptional antiterminator NusG